jgi:hypothetical protein
LMAADFVASSTSGHILCYHGTPPDDMGTAGDIHTQIDDDDVWKETTEGYDSKEEIRVGDSVGLLTGQLHLDGEEIRFFGPLSNIKVNAGSLLLIQDCEIEGMDIDPMTITQASSPLSATVIKYSYFRNVDIQTKTPTLVIDSVIGEDSILTLVGGLSVYTLNADILFVGGGCIRNPASNSIVVLLPPDTPTPTVCSESGPIVFVDLN